MIIVDLFDSIFLFPVFIFLFIVHRVGHPIKDHPSIRWLYAPYIFSVITSVFEIARPLYTSFVPSLLIKVIDAINVVIQLGFVFVFIPAVLYYAYRYIDHSSDLAERRWLTRIWGLIVLFLVSLLLTLVIGVVISIAIEEDVINTVVYPVAMILAFFIYWVTYSGIFRFKLARDQEAIRALINSKRNSATGDTTSNDASILESDIESPTEDTSDNTYLNKLELLCTEERIYRDNTLDREKVADMLGISAGYLSQTVNSTVGKNFATYINEYRVEEVKRLMVDPEFTDYSLLAIGLECGFSSKTTFHNTFKKMTGMTPNAYRKAHV